ncbi:glycoside hydrolase family 43 protein [Paenibacillus sp. MMO-58]|uniref:glycoside hydrolase family 43 protein n=1 Tax=Paenibacillus sp. MMO-58 TaxID=3081290 RepID=UPI0030181046
MADNYAGYLFAYFKGNETAEEEQVYFALSKGNDPLHWHELNGGRPVLTSYLGEGGVRDPYLARSPQGDKFYLVATDLSIYRNPGWNRAITSGSRSIMVWHSYDLMNWSDQRMAEVAPDDAGCAWAPEIFYDAGCRQYKIFWASSGSGRYHRMMVAATKDFIHFSKPKVYMDYGYSVLDATLIEHNGLIYRFAKGKNIIQEVGTGFEHDKYKMIHQQVEQDFMVRGEGPIIFKSNLEEKWYLFIDEFGFRGYIPLVTSDLGSGKWQVPAHYTLPGQARHGSVIPVTLMEYDRLLQAYG